MAGNDGGLLGCYFKISSMHDELFDQILDIQLSLYEAMIRHEIEKKKLWQ